MGARRFHEIKVFSSDDSEKGAKKGSFFIRHRGRIEVG